MGDTRSAITLDLVGLQTLVDLLAGDGFTVLGPTVRDGAIVPGPVGSLDDLPRGCGDVRQPSSYRLTRRDDDALFGYAADLISWKAVTFPAQELLWQGTGSSDGFTVDAAHAVSPLGEPPYALIGIRSCDVHALAHPRPGAAGSGVPGHPVRRPARVGLPRHGGVLRPERHLLLRVDGHRSRGRSRATDLALTELLDGPHRFLVAAGSDRGAALLDRLPSLLRRGGGGPGRRRPRSSTAPWPGSAGSSTPPISATCSKARFTAAAAWSKSVNCLGPQRLPERVLLGVRHRRDPLQSRIRSS